VALGIVQLAIGTFGLLVALAAFGAFRPFERLVRGSPRGRAVYALVAFFATFLVVSGVRELA
jgi:hypothetical protein